MNEVEKAAFIKEIIRAFRKVPQPKRHIGISSNLELENFVKKNWDEVTAADFDSAGGPFLFGGVAFRYFLPAFMIAVIRDYRKIRLHILDDYIWYLGERNKTVPSILCSIFSDEQRAVIIQFLKLYPSFAPLPHKRPRNIAEAKAIARGDRTKQGLEALQAAIDYWEHCEENIPLNTENPKGI